MAVTRQRLPASIMTPEPSCPAARKVPELVAPAGSLAAFQAGLKAGADAFYLGIGVLNARARAQNFRLEDLPDLVGTAREHGKRIYLALNVLVSDGEIRECVGILEQAEAYGVDAVIIQDLGVLYLVRKHFPDLRVHASTQMFLHNSLHVQALASRGVSRVVLPRELRIEEIRALRSTVAAELEVFVHGALCFSFSGLCLASSFLFGESGNRGVCKQVCRFAFATEGPGDRPGERDKTVPAQGEEAGKKTRAAVVSGDGVDDANRDAPGFEARGSSAQGRAPRVAGHSPRAGKSRPAPGVRRHPGSEPGTDCRPFAMRDLEGRTCLEELLATGVDSLKIEGRLRNTDYLDEVVSFYRHCLDAYAAGRPLPGPPPWRFNRSTTPGYFVPRAWGEMICADGEPWIGERVGRVARLSAGKATLVFDQPVFRGERLRVLREDGVKVHEFTLLDHRGRQCEIEVGRQAGTPSSWQVLRVGTSRAPALRGCRRGAGRLKSCPARLAVRYGQGVLRIEATLGNRPGFRADFVQEYPGPGRAGGGVENRPGFRADFVQEYPGSGRAGGGVENRPGFQADFPLDCSPVCPPLSPERVRDCFCRVDRAPFRVQEIAVDLDDALTLPIRDLNAVRRDFYGRMEAFLDAETSKRNHRRRLAIEQEFSELGARFGQAGKGERDPQSGEGREVRPSGEHGRLDSAGRQDKSSGGYERGDSERGQYLPYRVRDRGGFSIPAGRLADLRGRQDRNLAEGLADSRVFRQGFSGDPKANPVFPAGSAGDAFPAPVEVVPWEEVRAGVWTRRRGKQLDPAAVTPGDEARNGGGRLLSPPCRWMELPLFVSEGALAEMIRELESALGAEGPGFVCHSLGWIDHLRGRVAPERIAAGGFLYCFNRFAYRILREAGAGTVFLSPDFSPGDVRDLLGFAQTAVARESRLRFFVTRHILPAAVYRLGKTALQVVRRREYSEVVLVPKL